MAALSGSSLSQPWQQNNPQSTSEGNRGNKRRKTLVYGVASQEPKDVVPELKPDQEEVLIKVNTLNNNMVASQLLIKNFKKKLKS